ncbi:MAG: PH domain-containing protein [Armatimonadetes bacterium]|nr:PH domain-containing protein [Akkermansiaceae bacterium]
MGLFDALTNNASEIPAAQAQEELGPLLIDGETVRKAYRLVRDLIAFTLPGPSFLSNTYETGTQ